MESWAIKKFINVHMFRLWAAWLRLREAYETDTEVNPLDEYHFSMEIMQLDDLCDKLAKETDKENART